LTPAIPRIRIPATTCFIEGFENGGYRIMTVTESIQEYAQRLPLPLQLEVLDFVKFLLFKKEQAAEEQDDSVWSGLSLELAMQGMEDEDAPLYTVEDLQEVFS
jgi:hypothetical protein